MFFFSLFKIQNTEYKVISCGAIGLYCFPKYKYKIWCIKHKTQNTPYKYYQNTETPNKYFFFFKQNLRWRDCIVLFAKIPNTEYQVSNTKHKYNDKHQYKYNTEIQDRHQSLCYRSHGQAGLAIASRLKYQKRIFSSLNRTGFSNLRWQDWPAFFLSPKYQLQIIRYRISNTKYPIQLTPKYWSTKKVFLLLWAERDLVTSGGEIGLYCIPKYQLQNMRYQT